MKKLLFLMLIISTINAQILLFTYAHNRTDFIRLQHRCFEKFLQDDYHFIVFNDAKTDSMAQDIQQTCDELNLTCIRIPQEIHEMPYLQRPPHGPFADRQQGSVRNCNVVQYSLNEVGFHHDDIVALFDSDMFLIKPFSLHDYMKNKDVAGFYRPCDDFILHNCSKQHRGIPKFGYIWIGIAFLNMSTMPNKNSIDFNCGFVNPGRENYVDAGGFTYYYIKNNPDAAIHYFNRIQIPELWCNECLQTRKTCTHNKSKILEYGFDKNDVEFLQHAPVFQVPTLPPEWFVEYYLDGKFIHFRGGTRDTIYQKKEEYIIPFIEQLLNS